MNQGKSHRMKRSAALSLFCLVCCLAGSRLYAQEEGLKTQVVDKKNVGGKEGLNLSSLEASAPADAIRTEGLQSFSMPLSLPHLPSFQRLDSSSGMLRSEPRASNASELERSPSVLETVSQQFTPAPTEKNQTVGPMPKPPDCVDCSLSSVERAVETPVLTPSSSFNPGAIERFSSSQTNVGGKAVPMPTPLEALPLEFLPQGRKGEAGEGQSAAQPVRLVLPSDLQLKPPSAKPEENRQELGGDERPPQANAASWQSLLVEDFATTFPANWQISYSTGGPYFWDDVAANPHTGSRSGWCAGGTVPPNPVLDPNTGFYVNSMSSWMIYGPFNLSDATDAKVDFWYWLNSELNFDYLIWAASVDASTFYGFSLSGNSNGYVSNSFDLKTVPTLGNLTGRSGVYIAFIFQSDASVTNRGAFLDDIDLQKFVPTPTAELVADRVYLRTGPNSGDPDVTTPIAGQPYYVHIDFRNTGAATASNYLVQIRLNGTVLCAGNFTTTAGASEIAWCTNALTWPSGGNTIEGVLDVNNIVVEPNESNNTTSRFYPEATPFAQLVADRMYLRTGPNSGAFVDVPLPGQPYYVHMDWRNASSTAANNFRLEIKLNGSVLCANSSQSAGANTSSTTWCTTALTWPGGGATIEGLLDVNGTIAESVENDNTAARIFGFQTYEDFELTCQVRSAETFTSNPGADFCLIYGYQDDQHYYYVMFNRNTNDTRVFKIRGTTRTEIGNLGTFIIPDVNYHEVRLRRTGSTLQVYFDGVSLGTAVDSEYGLGGLGLGSFNDSSMWDDVCIRRLTSGNCDLIDDFEDLNANDWIPLHPSRWQVITHQGDHSYYLNTTNFESVFDLRLGEYSLLNSQIELVADDVFLRTGPNSGSVVNNPVAGVPYYLHFDWRNTGRAPALGFLFELRALNRDTCGYGGVALAFSTHNSWCTSPITFPVGTATLEGTLDFGNVLFEHNKTNNVIRRTLTVTAATDLVAGQMYLRTGQNSGTIVNSPIPGQQYFVHFDWSNTGSTSATSNLEIKLNNVALCSGSVTAGPNSNLTTWCTSPVTWPSGSNTIRGELDTNNAIAESNESNNVTTRTYPQTPDLIADRIYLRTGQNSGDEVSNPVAGVPYFVHLDWRNVGGATGAFRLELRHNGAVLCFNANQTAGANTTVITLCTSPVTFSPGTQTFEGVLDVNNAIVEVLENNNAASRTFNVPTPQQADLVADRMYLRTGQNSGDEVNNPVAGVPYFIHFDWRNAGAVAANGFRLDISADGAVQCFNGNTNAPANTSFISWCTTPVTFTEGTHTLAGALDVSNAITEQSESNNTVGRTIVVGPMGCNPQACSGPAVFPVKEGGSVVGEVITGRNGSTVCVDIRIRQNTIPIDAFGFVVQVDPTRLAFVSAAAGNLTGNFIQVTGQESPAGSGTIRCGGFGTTAIPINSAGVVIKLCFRVLCSSPSLPASDIVISSPTDDVATMAVCCNKFNCVDCLRNGDVDGNGLLSPGDALCAFKIFLNGGVLPADCDFPNTTCELIAADPNCDGAITPGDALAIFNRYLAGLPPQECFARTVLSKFEAGGANQLTLKQHTVMNAAEAGGKDLVKVALAVKNPAGLQAFGLNLIYPAHKLTLMGVRRTALTENWLQLDGRSNAPGVVTIGGFNPEALASARGNELFEVWFKAEGQAVNAGDFVIDDLLDDFSGLLGEVKPGAQTLAAAPETYKLHQNYPNPFHPGASANLTMVRFDIPGKEAAKVELAIYNLSGQLVRRLLSGNHAPGAYELPWDGRNEQGQLVPSGAYIYKLRAGNFVESKTLTVVR